MHCYYNRLSGKNDLVVPVYCLLQQSTQLHCLRIHQQILYQKLIHLHVLMLPDLLYFQTTTTLQTNIEASLEDTHILSFSTPGSSRILESQAKRLKSGFGAVHNPGSATSTTRHK